jgi:Fe-S-cluster containining protein
MRRDRLLLRAGYTGSLVLGLVVYLLGFGWPSSVVIVISIAILTRLSIYLYFERHLAFRAFEDFRTEKVRHECIACGASCHLRVNLAKDDIERILNYAKDKRMNETVIEKSGNKFWLKRQKDGACTFLTYEAGKPRCSIYGIRPTACRLYPLIPVGSGMKVDPLCPGLSRTQGHTFKQHLVTQEIGSYVRRVMGKI